MKPLPTQWSLHPLLFPRSRGTGTPKGRGTNCEKVKKESPSKLNGLYTPFVPGGQEPRRGGELIVEDKKV